MSICGGVISESELKKRIDNGTAEGVMMCFVMPDDKFDEYVKFKKENKHKEAKKIFNKYAMSMI